MSFADNLKILRKNNNLTQEELAEALNVSRQAVSKWEQSLGYPETETLIQISKKFNVSIDGLLSDNLVQSKEADFSNNKRILITSYDGKNIVDCYKIKTSEAYKARENEAKYALFGIDSCTNFGENSTILGWYDSLDNIKKEMEEISQAMIKGIRSYKIQYAVEVKFHWGKMKIVNK